MKYHLNIQCIKQITACQSEKVYSSWNQVFLFLWCSDQHCWMICRKYYLHVFSPFSFLLSNLSITECIFNIIVTSFKSRQFLYQLHIWYCMFPLPPPFWHQFLHLMIQFDTSMFIDTDRKTVKHTNTEKSWRGVSKGKIYMFSVSNRCRMGYRQIPVNRNLIQIHAQILNFISSNSSCTDRLTWSISPASQLSVHFSLHISIVSKWNISTVMCIVSTPPPPSFSCYNKNSFIVPTHTRIVSNNIINMHILSISTKMRLYCAKRVWFDFLPVSLMVGTLY